MTIFVWIVSVILILVGLAGIIVPALPGTPVMFAGFLIAAWLDNFQEIGWITLTILAVLTTISQVIDFVTTSMGAKKMGASRLAITGTLIGMFVGIFFGIVGIILGPFIGAVLGEFITRRDLLKAGKVGFGTWLGIVIGIAARLGLAVAMVGIFITAFFI